MSDEYERRLERAAADGNPEARAALERHRQRREDDPRVAGLTPSQAACFRDLERGRNVFLTGQAGTGKSYLLEHWLNEGRARNVAVTASTGIAALKIGGETVHRWAGIKPHHTEPSHVTAGGWWRFTYPRIRNTDVLIVDEISMCSASVLNLLNHACRAAKRSKDPFGGMQVVFTGDMAQLPPVDPAEGFPFECRWWDDAHLLTHRLIEVVRQEDAEFCQALTEASWGQLSWSSFRLLEERVHAWDPTDVTCTRVVTHNRQADRINQDELDDLLGDPVTWQGRSAGNPNQVAVLKKRCLSPQDLQLKSGAQAMFTANDPAGRWVNGTTGIVLDPGNPLRAQSLPMVEIDGYPYSVDPHSWELTEKDPETGAERHLATFRQIPLRLAWAITTHKSQGMTLDRVSVDLSRVFSPGQGYVAISRARALEGLNIEGWRGAASFSVDPKVAQFLQGRWENRRDQHNPAWGWL